MTYNVELTDRTTRDRLYLRDLNGNLTRRHASAFRIPTHGAAVTVAFEIGQRNEEYRTRVIESEPAEVLTPLPEPVYLSRDALRALTFELTGNGRVA